MSMITRFIIGVAGVGIVSAGAFALDMTTRDENGAIIQEGELGVFSFKKLEEIYFHKQLAKQFPKRALIYRESQNRLKR